MIRFTNGRGPRLAFGFGALSLLLLALFQNMSPPVGRGIIDSSSDVSGYLLKVAAKSNDMPVEIYRELTLYEGEFQRGDINNSGSITSADALIMHRFASGLLNQVNPAHSHKIIQSILPLVKVKTPLAHSVSDIPLRLLSLAVKLDDGSDLSAFLLGKVDGFQRGDINKSGSITSADSLIMLRFVGGALGDLSVDHISWIKKEILPYLMFPSRLKISPNELVMDIFRLSMKQDPLNLESKIFLEGMTFLNGGQGRFKRADIDNNGAVTSSDALALHKYLSGLEAEIPPSQVNWIRQQIIAYIEPIEFKTTIAVGPSSLKSAVESPLVASPEPPLQPIKPEPPPVQVAPQPVVRATSTLLMYRNETLVGTTPNITKDSAYENCKMNATQNPSFSIKCLWAGAVLYSQTGKTALPAPPAVVPPVKSENPTCVKTDPATNICLQTSDGALINQCKLVKAFGTFRLNISEKDCLGYIKSSDVQSVFYGDRKL